MLLVSSPDLWKRMLLKCSISIVLSCPLLSLCTISYPILENDNVVLFSFIPHLHAVGQLVVHRPSRIVTNPKEKSCPDLYPLIRKIEVKYFVTLNCHIKIINYLEYLVVIIETLLSVGTIIIFFTCVLFINQFFSCMTLNLLAG